MSGHTIKAFIPQTDKMGKAELEAARAFIADGVRRKTWKKVEILMLNEDQFIKKDDNGQFPTAGRNN
jgi:hypothetical protein